jgi:transposase InsO family protein
MRDLIILFVHVIITICRLWRPGGTRSLIAESILLKQQLLILNRSRKRAPNLKVYDRFIAGVCSMFMKSSRLIRSAIVLKPSTLLSIHHALRNRKYRALFSHNRKRKPGPNGPSKELIDAIVDTKRRNPAWGCPRIAQQIALAFGIPMDKDIVRRVLASHYKPDPDSCGPSWLTFLGHTKDSLWSLDLFRCESISLRTHWILIVMDQFTRRIVGFGVHAGNVDGTALCRMFNHAISSQGAMPKYLSSDNDPLFLFERWKTNLRILDVAEIKTVPYVPLSHPFVERLIGTVRREYLDRIMFWTRSDLEDKLLDFQNYYNGHRTHSSLEGRTPNREIKNSQPFAELHSYRWQSHCRGLYQTPIAA